MTTIVNWAVFFLFFNLLSVNVYVANAIAWVASVVFAFFTNRSFVFHSQKKLFTEMGIEFFGFISGRLFSGALEMLFLFLGIDLLGINENIVKIIVAVIVVILNYIISKLLFSRKKDETLC